MASIYKKTSPYLGITFVASSTWLWVWLPFILLSSVSSLLAGRWTDLPSLMYLGVLGMMLGCLELKKILLRRLLLTSLCLTVVCGGIVQLIAPQRWLNSDRSSLTSFLSSLQEDQLSTPSTRRWRVASAIETLELSLEAKLTAGTLGWQWSSSSGGFGLEPRVENNRSFTRVSTPRSGDPYLMRTFTLDQSTAGQTFRVDLAMRSQTPVVAEGCRGVWLQVWYDGGDASCLATNLTPQWQSFSHTWTAPQSATSKVIRVVLNDFDGLSYDVANTKLYMLKNSDWQELTPLLPSIPALSTSWETSESDSGHALTLTDQWQPFRFTIVKEVPSDTLNVTLSAPAGITLATRNVTLSVPATPVAEMVRQSYFFGHPNLAGHVVVVFALLALALSSGLTLQLFISALGVAACYFTGSRTAWLVLMAGVVVLIWLQQPKKHKWLLVIYSVAALSLMASWQYLGRLQITGISNPSSRQEIWLTSLRIVRDHFWTGIGTSHQRFSELWFLYSSQATEAVTHAHNLGLEWLVNFGVFGGLAILWLVTGFFRSAYLRKGSLGVAITTAVLALNMADVSLFYTWVLAPFILYLNSRDQQSNDERSPT